MEKGMDFTKLSQTELETFAGRNATLEDASVRFNQMLEEGSTDFPEYIRDLYLISNYNGSRDTYYTEEDIFNADDSVIQTFAQIFGLDTTGMTLIEVRFRVLRILRFLDMIVPPVELGQSATFIPFTRDLIDDPGISLDDENINDVEVPDLKTIGSSPAYLQKYIKSAPIIEADGPIRVRTNVFAGEEVYIYDSYVVPVEGVISFEKLMEALFNNSRVLKQVLTFAEKYVSHKDERPGYRRHVLKADGIELEQIIHRDGPYFESKFA